MSDMRKSKVRFWTRAEVFDFDRSALADTLMSLDLSTSTAPPTRSISCWNSLNSSTITQSNSTDEVGVISQSQVQVWGRGNPKIHRSTFEFITPSLAPSSTHFNCVLSDQSSVVSHWLAHHSKRWTQSEHPNHVSRPENPIFGPSQSKPLRAKSPGFQRSARLAKTFLVPACCLHAFIHRVQHHCTRIRSVCSSSNMHSHDLGLANPKIWGFQVYNDFPKPTPTLDLEPQNRGVPVLPLPHTHSTRWSSACLLCWKLCNRVYDCLLTCSRPDWAAGRVWVVDLCSQVQVLGQISLENVKAISGPKVGFWPYCKHVLFASPQCKDIRSSSNHVPEHEYTLHCPWNSNM